MGGLTVLFGLITVVMLVLVLYDVAWYISLLLYIVLLIILARLWYLSIKSYDKDYRDEHEDKWGI